MPFSSFELRVTKRVLVTARDLFQSIIDAASDISNEGALVGKLKEIVRKTDDVIADLDGRIKAQP